MAKTKKEAFEELKQRDDVEVIVPDRGLFADREVIVKKTRESVAISEPLVPFDRWFAAKGFKERWKSGMIAFTDVSIRRTMSEWNQIFASY